MYSENLNAIHLETGHDVPTRIDYSSFDPLSIHLQFAVAPGQYRDWEFARDLLMAGLASEPWTGLGDVQVCRADDDFLGLRLSSPSGRATFLLPLIDVSRFLGRTLLEMPVGDERVDTDALATVE